MLSKIEIDSKYTTQDFNKTTKWVVITGAPSSGKTSVLKELEKKGYCWIPEVAREYIEKKLANGLDLSEVRQDESKFQKDILSEKLDIEANLSSDKVIFLDRGVPDSITYYRASGLNPNDAAKECFLHRYDKVFLFERLPIESDHARTENEEEVDVLQCWLESDYKKIGYDVIRVPVMSIEQRVDFILLNLSK